MYGIMPAADNMSWSGEADKLAHDYFYGKTLHGNIVFRYLLNCLLVYFVHYSYFVVMVTHYG